MMDESVQDFFKDVDKKEEEFRKDKEEMDKV